MSTGWGVFTTQDKQEAFRGIKGKEFNVFFFFSGEEDFSTSLDNQP